MFHTARLSASVLAAAALIGLAACANNTPPASSAAATQPADGGGMSTHSAMAVSSALGQRLDAMLHASP